MRWRRHDEPGGLRRPSIVPAECCTVAAVSPSSRLSGQPPSVIRIPQLGSAMYKGGFYEGLKDDRSVARFSGAKVDGVAVVNCVQDELAARTSVDNEDLHRDRPAVTRTLLHGVVAGPASAALCAAPSFPSGEVLRCPRLFNPLRNKGKWILVDDTSPAAEAWGSRALTDCLYGVTGWPVGSDPVSISGAGLLNESRVRGACRTHRKTRCAPWALCRMLGQAVRTPLLVVRQGRPLGRPPPKVWPHFGDTLRGKPCNRLVGDAHRFRRSTRVFELRWE